MSRIIRMLVAVLAVCGLALIGLLTSAGAALADAGTTLSETITANPSLTRTFHWSIDKSVNKNTLNMFKGDSGAVTYSVNVTKDQGTVDASVSGQVCITNGGAVDTQGLQSTLELSMPPDKTIIQQQPLDVSSEPVIPAGQNACYDYKMMILNPVPGGSYKITADTTITNHSGSTVGVGGPQESASFSLPSAATPVHDSVDVSDSMQGDLGTISGSQQFTYGHTFNCNDDKGGRSNTASLTYADGTQGPSASANVQVNCYELGVTKTANTSFTRTWQWHVNKSADQSSLTLVTGQTFDVHYKVDVTATPSDASWAVGGAITVHNPAPIDAVINSVSDVLPGGAQASLTDAPQFPYTLPTGQDLVIHYTASLSDSSAGTNTATATLQNSPSGTTDFQGSKDYSFDLSHPTTVVDGSANLSDTYASSGLPATVNAGDMPQSYTYTRTVGPYSSPGSYSVDNTVTVAGNDDGNGNSSSVHIPVNVPSNGCTLTIGYWKTHLAATAKYLPIWLGTPGGTNSVQVITASQASTILAFNGNASNGINKLEGQLLAAKLSIAAGADSSAVSSTISAADAFLASHPASSWTTLSKAQQTQVNGWATALDSYNNGLTGPGHCSQ